MPDPRPTIRAVLCAFLVIGPCAVHAEEADAETWFARRLTTGDAPLRIEYFWSKGRKLRAETVVAERPVLTLVNGEHYYVIDPLAGTGVAIRRGAGALGEDQGGGRPFATDSQALLDGGAEKVGEDRLSGRPCDVYRLTDRRGRREVCVTQDELRLPLRAEQFDRSSRRTVEVRYLDWSRGFPAPDAFFEPDPRIAIERVGYDDYLRRSAKEEVGPAPVLYRALLHGR